MLQVTETTLHTVRTANKRREHERLLQEKRNTNTALKEQDELDEHFQQFLPAAWASVSSRKTCILLHLFFSQIIFPQ
jgi:hypothetical protein